MQRNILYFHLFSESQLLQLLLYIKQLFQVHLVSRLPVTFTHIVMHSKIIVNETTKPPTEYQVLIELCGNREVSKGKCERSK